MKKKAKILSLAVSLAVLAAAWLLAESMAGRVPQRQDEDAEIETVTIALSVGEAEDILGLNWTCGDEAVSLAWDEKTTAWVNADDRDCPVDQAMVTPLVEAVADIHALLSISHVTDFAQYGLEEPVATIMVETADHAVTYAIGHQTLTGEYYLRVDEGDTVYTETGTLMPAFRIGLEELLAIEAAPEDIASVTAMTVTTNAESYKLRWWEDMTDVWYGSAYQWYVNRGEETLPLTAESAAALYEMVTDIQYLQCVDWHRESFARYGLDEPQGIAAVTYIAGSGEEKSVALRFGDYDGGHVYVNPEGSEMVYLASGTVLDGLMRPDWEAMTPLMVCPVDGAALTGLLVELGGHTYDIEIHRETEETVDEEGNTVLEAMDYYVSNGWTLDEDASAAWLAELITLKAESLAPEEPGEEALLAVTFRLDSETWPEVSVAVYGYDSARCLCVVNGEHWYFLSRETAEGLIAGAESLLILE